MSLALIEAEVRRFLSSTTPEVLCIKGRWGVGKTYGWRGFLRAANQSKALAMQRYSYVSLFGLNSLDDLRYSVFENTVTAEKIGQDPDATTFRELFQDGDTVRKLRSIVEFMSTVFNRKGLADLLSKSAFLMVRNQLICLDDLERAGNNLGTREVLGLASLLKEQRKCKVVLLLNDEEHDQISEFERQLEKVADITLRFDPTSDEAATIALSNSKEVADLLKPRIINLSITNIRVIKKIERLAIRLIFLLSDYDVQIVQEAIATLVLASWAVQQPKLAPTLEFLRDYNSLVISMRVSREALDPETERFSRMIANYPFNSANDLDQIIIDGAEAGYFDEPALRDAAEHVAAERKASSRTNNFTRVWHDLYHGSLVTDDDDFLDELYKSASEETGAISLVNLNAVIRLLRETGRDDQASQLIAAYISAHAADSIEFFKFNNHHFSTKDTIDSGLRDAFAKLRASYIDPRDPLDVLRAMGVRQGWDDADVELMAKQSADEFELMFEALRGDEVRDSITIIQALGASRSPQSDAIGKASLTALCRIAAKSPLRGRKIRALGVECETNSGSAAEGEGEVVT